MPNISCINVTTYQSIHTWLSPLLSVSRSHLGGWHAQWSPSPHHSGGLSWSSLWMRSYQGIFQSTSQDKYDLPDVICGKKKTKSSAILKTMKKQYNLLKLLKMLFFCEYKYSMIWEEFEDYLHFLFNDIVSSDPSFPPPPVPFFPPHKIKLGLISRTCTLAMSIKSFANLNYQMAIAMIC